jgi:hypothetical protein
MGNSQNSIFNIQGNFKLQNPSRAGGGKAAPFTHFEVAAGVPPGAKAHLCLGTLK